MGTQKKLADCESAWECISLRAQLEAQLSGEQSAEDSALLHLRLGLLLQQGFLEGVSALRHFQEAFKIDPNCMDAVKAARLVYRELGRLPLVQKLLKIEISGVSDDEQRAELYRALGEVLVDQGDAESAMLALSEAKSFGAEVGDEISDLESSEDDWSERVAELVRLAGTKNEGLRTD